MPAAVETEGLTRRFDGVTAVDHLDLNVTQGEIFGLVGPDGAGKTTTLRILCGLLEASEGKARVYGHDVSRDTRAVKDSMGYMAQRLGLYGDLTVDENMSFYADVYGVGQRERAELIPPLLRMTRMEPFRQRQAAKLSGGMKQKLGLMCALLHRPKVLFLDEPTTGVDPVSRRDFWTILYQLAQDGISVFLTTAYLDEAERCHRVGLLHHGRMICCGTPEALRSHLEEVCYEVQAPELRPVRQVLQSFSEVLCAQSAGPVVHLFLAPSIEPDSIQRKLLELGITDVALRRVDPTLEDVFIALVRKAQKL
jgi:drug efflux transport system ATP-binding protein